MIFEQTQDFENRYHQNLLKFIESEEDCEEYDFLLLEISRVESRIEELTNLTDKDILKKYTLKYESKIKDSSGTKEEVDKWLNGWVVREKYEIPNKIEYLKEILLLYKIKLKRLSNSSSENGIDRINKKEHPGIFRNQNAYDSFLLYSETCIVEPYIDYSYLFQRMLEKKNIYPMKHKAFMNWLRDNKCISEKRFNEFMEMGFFRSLSKSYSEYRANNYNNIFKSK